jgi:hypothetical protein
MFLAVVSNLMRRIKLILFQFEPVLLRNSGNWNFSSCGTNNPLKLSKYFSWFSLWFKSNYHFSVKCSHVFRYKWRLIYWISITGRFQFAGTAHIKNNKLSALGHKLPFLSKTSTTNDKSFPSGLILFLSAVSLGCTFDPQYRLPPQPLYCHCHKPPL